MTLRLSAAFLATALIVVAVPFITNADKSMGVAANQKCLPYAIGPCPCGTKQGQNGCESDPNNKFMCDCSVSPTGGTVKAQCVATFDCKGMGTEKGGLGDMKGFMDMMKSIMDMLKPKDSPPSPSTPPTTPPGSTCPSGGTADATGKCGCTAYYQVTVPTSDPCAYYIPPTSSQLNAGSSTSAASDLLLNALNGTTQSALDSSLGGTTNVSDQLNGNIADVTTPSPSASTDEAPPFGGLSGGGESVSLPLPAGTLGNIEMTDTGVTVFARARDTIGNTEIAGFYGSDTMGNAQPNGLVANLCRSRPWSGSVVAFLIPPAFFDGLCTWRGYNVGIPQPPAPVQQQVIVQQQTPKPQPQQQAPAPQPTGEPEADIWAVPASVPLGARTSVFWNTKNVTSCEETSPDGSFHENTLSGGASTVPLTGATTFSISCLTADGKHVTNSVTVDLSI